jgi:hypothetical protein
VIKKETTEMQRDRDRRYRGRVDKETGAPGGQLASVRSRPKGNLSKCRVRQGIEPLLYMQEEWCTCNVLISCCGGGRGRARNRWH